MNSFNNKNEKEKIVHAIDEILDKEVKSKSKLSTGDVKKYRHLLVESVELTKVVRIERQDNKNCHIE